jgi:hypothetical protein
VFVFIPDSSVDPKRIIPSKWVLGLKLNADGSTNKWKARLVGRGDRQVEGRDFGDITSLVVDSTSIRLILGIAARENLDMATLDVPTAFLGCPLEGPSICVSLKGYGGAMTPTNDNRQQCGKLLAICLSSDLLTTSYPMNATILERQLNILWSRKYFVMGKRSILSMEIHSTIGQKFAITFINVSASSNV